MKHFALLPTIFMLVVLSACMPTKSTLPKIEKVTTQAGHEVYYIPLETETVSIRAAFPSSYLFTEGANPATPHLGLKLIQQAGAGNIQPAALVEELDKLDAKAELLAQADMLRGKLVADADKIEEAAKLANQVLAQSSLDEKWFGRVAGNLSEIAVQDRSKSDVVGWNAMRYLNFDPQVAGFWTAQFDDVRAVTHQQVKDWYEQSFSSKDALIVLSGPEDMATGLRAVDVLLDGLDQKTPRASVKMQQAYKKRAQVILIENAAAKDAQILMFDAVQGEARAKEAEAFLTTYVLGATPESRLHRKLRDEMRAAYSPFALLVDFDRNVRLIAMGAQVAPDQAVNALNAASKIYDQLQKEGLDQAEFDTAKSTFLGHFNSSLNEKSLPPNMVMEILLEGFEADHVNDLIPTYEAITLKDQNDFMRTQLTPSDQLLRIIVAPNIDEIEFAGACRVKNPEQLSNCI